MEQDHSSGCEEFDGEETTFGGGEDAEELLEGKYYENDETSNKGSDRSSGIPYITEELVIASLGMFLRAFATERVSIMKIWLLVTYMPMLRRRR